MKTRSSTFEKGFYQPLPDAFEDISRVRITPSKIFEYAINVCKELSRSTVIKDPSSPLDEWISSKTIRASDNKYITQTYDFESIEDEIYYAEYCSEAIDAYDQYYSLENGWDGEDAVAPSSGTLEDAKFLLRVISAYSQTCPRIHPTLDLEGIPGALIDDGSIYLSLSFYGEHSFTLFVRDRATTHTQVTTNSIFDDIEIFNLLKIINSL